MFSKPYEGVKYFGHWADESAGRYGRRDAMAVLKDALDRCVDEDKAAPKGEKCTLTTGRRDRRRVAIVSELNDIKILPTL